MSESLAGRQIILVEDESIVALLLEDMLDEVGCVLAGTASSVEEGMALAATTEADAAILDVNVRGRDVFPVAERLMERRIPFVFSTGYGATGLPEAWRAWPVVVKPFTLESLAAALETALRIDPAR